MRRHGCHYMKYCTTCCQTKEPDQFSKRAASKDGLSAKCKQCAAEYDSSRYEQRAAEAVQRVNEWRKANPEKTLAQRAKYRERYREKIAEKNRARYAANIEAERQRSADYHARNPEKALERGRRWKEQKPEAARARDQRRKALVRGAEGSHTGEDLKSIYAMQRGKCAVCRVDFEGTKYHVDHIWPIARGGSNDKTNLQLLCQPCNQQKGAKIPEEFMRQKGYLL